MKRKTDPDKMKKQNENEKIDSPQHEITKYLTKKKFIVSQPCFEDWIQITFAINDLELAKKVFFDTYSKLSQNSPKNWPNFSDCYTNAKNWDRY